jgi:formylglycine-generating enzyme required for sulfatase activity
MARAVCGAWLAVRGRRLAVSVLLLPASLAVAVPPAVTAVSFEQRPGSNYVDITYSLSDADGDDEFTVTFDVSTDGGQTFAIKPERWTGAAGPGVTAGSGKKIVWDALGDCRQLQCDRVVVRVSADDGRLAKRTEPAGERPGTPAGTKARSGEETSPGGNERTWAKDGSVMVRVPAGTFTMGSSEYDDEKPVHDVYVDEFWIDKYEVTNRQYKRFCDATDRSYPLDPDFLGMPNYFENKPEYPVVNVSWEDAQAYCAWAGKRLPTEAEWEKAARGTDSRKYPWGNAAPSGSRCNYADKRTDYSWRDRNADDGYARTAPVGTFPAGASPYGCQDMAGNVWEWCSDWYDKDYYGNTAKNNPGGPSSGSSRVIRGGSWICHATNLRCSDRFDSDPASRHYNLGFRCVVR